MEIEMETEHLIVGGGIAGLLYARLLHESGRPATVLDKGRGFGGRLATRRGEGVRFDHGAQYFTVRDARFARWVERMMADNVVRVWFEKGEGSDVFDAEPAYAGVTGMSDVAKWLASPLDLHRSQRVTALRWREHRWEAETQDGLIWKTPMLTLANPLPQALDLLAGSGYPLSREEVDDLAAVTYAKSIAVMAVLDGPSGLPKPGGVKINDPALSWIADNRMKGISEGEAVTLHSTAEFGEEHWDSEDGVRGPLLLEAARPFLRAEPLSWTCHRWGCAFPHHVYPRPFAAPAAGALRLIGDGFGGARMEGAAVSALEAFASL